MLAWTLPAAHRHNPELPTLSMLTCRARRMRTRREKAVYDEMVLSLWQVWGRREKVHGGSR